MHGTSEIAIWVVKNQASGQETFLKNDNSFECPLLLSKEQGKITPFSRGVYLTGISWVFIARLGVLRYECPLQVTQWGVRIQLQCYTVQTSSKPSKHSLWTQKPSKQSFAEANFSIKLCMWQSFASPKYSRWLSWEALKGWKEVTLLGGVGSTGQIGAFPLFLR